MMTDGDWHQRDPRDEQAGGSRHGYVEQYQDERPPGPRGRDEQYEDGRPKGRRGRVQQHDYSDYDYTPREHKHPRLRAWAPST